MSFAQNHSTEFSSFRLIKCNTTHVSLTIRYEFLSDFPGKYCGVFSLVGLDFAHDFRRGYFGLGPSDHSRLPARLSVRGVRGLDTHARGCSWGTSRGYERGWRHSSSGRGREDGRGSCSGGCGCSHPRGRQVPLLKLDYLTLLRQGGEGGGQGRW